MTPVLSAQLSVCYCLLLVGLGSLLFVDAVVCLFVCLHVSEHSDHHLYEYKIYQEWMHKVAPTPITEMCRPCLIIIQSCHHMFSLRDPHFVFCSRDLDVLRARRITVFFILITHKSTKSANPTTWYILMIRQCARGASVFLRCIQIFL